MDPSQGTRPCWGVVMLDMVLDLFAHMEWADAEHWKAILAHHDARHDADIKARLVHMHGAQRIWLGRWQGLQMPWPKPEDYPALDDLRHFAAACHAAQRAYLPAIKDADLDRELAFTTLDGLDLRQPLKDTLLQPPLHSQYHRGQNALRLKALGAKVPGTDHVLWTRLGRPEPDWP